MNNNTKQAVYKCGPKYSAKPRKACGRQSTDTMLSSAETHSSANTYSRADNHLSADTHRRADTHSSTDSHSRVDWRAEAYMRSPLMGIPSPLLDVPSPLVDTPPPPADTQSNCPSDGSDTTAVDVQAFDELSETGSVEYDDCEYSDDSDDSTGTIKSVSSVSLSVNNSEAGSDGSGGSGGSDGSGGSGGSDGSGGSGGSDGSGGSGVSSTKSDASEWGKGTIRAPPMICVPRALGAGYVVNDINTTENVFTTTNRDILAPKPFAPKFYWKRVEGPDKKWGYTETSHRLTMVKRGKLWQ